MHKTRPTARLWLVLALAASLLIFVVAAISASAINKQQILFDVWYGNPWPGSTSHGIYLDENGTVFSFEIVDSGFNRLLTNIDRSVYFALDLYRQNGFSGKVVGKVDASVLQDMRRLVQRASAGSQFETRLSGCADSGLVSFVAHIYSAQTQLHTPIILYIAGDMMGKNETEESSQLVSWLTITAKQYGHDFEHIMEHCGPR